MKVYWVPLGLNYSCIVLVLSTCQTAQLNINDLKEHFRTISEKYNMTANNLKSRAENATQWMQQRNESRHQQQRYTRKQLKRARACHTVAWHSMWMAKYITKPRCAADGNFERIQCGWSRMKCWCVDENGKMVGYEKKPYNKLNCSSVDKGKKINRKKAVKGNLHCCNKLPLNYWKYYFNLKFVEINEMKALSERKITNKYQLFWNLDCLRAAILDVVTLYGCHY